MQKRTRPLQTNDEQQTLSPASKKIRKNPSNFFAISEDIQHHQIAVFLDNKTLAAYAVTHKAALQQVVPELRRRLPALAVKLITGGTHTFILNDKEVYACFTSSSSPFGMDPYCWNDEMPMGLGFRQVVNITGTPQQVATSSTHTFILTDKGLYACGDNECGQLGLGDEKDRKRFKQVIGITGTLQQVVAGYYCSFILTDKGLYACGHNSYGQLGLGDTQNRLHFTQVTGIMGIVQQITNDNSSHTFILTDKGLYAWGINSYGQLGLGDTQNRERFTLVIDTMGTVQQVVAGRFHTFILTDKGLYACGHNGFGQLGLGDTQNREHFTQVTGIMGTVQQVIAGGEHTFILTDNGLYACGLNRFGQLGLGDTQNRQHFTQVPGIVGTPQQVVAAGEHTFILTDKGLYACGHNTLDLLGLGHVQNATMFQPVSAIPKAIKDNGKHYQQFTRFIKASETLTFFSQTPSSNAMVQTLGRQEQQAQKDLTSALTRK